MTRGENVLKHYNQKLLSSLRQSPNLPKNLSKSWADVLRLLAESGRLPNLIRALHDFCAHSTPDAFSRDLVSVLWNFFLRYWRGEPKKSSICPWYDYSGWSNICGLVPATKKEVLYQWHQATTWICEIFRSMQTRMTTTTNSADRKNKSKQKFSDPKVTDILRLSFVDFKNDEAWQTVFWHILMNPNERTCSVLPLLSKVMKPPINPSQEKKILELIDVLSGRKVGQGSKQVINITFCFSEDHLEKADERYHKTLLEKVLLNGNCKKNVSTPTGLITWLL